MSRARANRQSNRVRVYDTQELAANMRETFTARPVQYETEFDMDWPASMQHIGDSLAVAYASDKWKPKKKNGRRELELYKHLAESRNRIFCYPGSVYLADSPSERLECIGPRVSFEGVPMPDSFAELARFEEVNVQLYTEGTDADPAFGAGEDNGVMTLTVRHGHLGGSFIRWGQLKKKRKAQPFLFVYTESDGIMFIIVGDDLAVEKDGIVG